MKKLVALKIAILSAFLMVSALLVPTVGAVDVFKNACSGAPSNAVCSARADDLAGLIGNVIRTLFLLVGIIAVIMIIVGGIRYITSNGDSSQVSSAKNTVLYAVIGLVIAISAFAIVNFVLDRI